jgi:hypothetical protein
MKIVSWKEAKARGLKRYFTGEPCKHGHIAERCVSAGDYIECKEAPENHRARGMEKGKPGQGARTTETMAIPSPSTAM